MPDDAWTPPAASSHEPPEPSSSSGPSRDGGGASGEPLAYRLGEMLRGLASGGGAAKVMSASHVIYEAGGKRVLSEAAKHAVRSAAESSATRAIGLVSGPLFQPIAALAQREGAAAVLSPAAVVATGAKAGVKTGAAALAKTAGRQASVLAAREVLKGAGKAAGIGFVVDGAVASFEAVVAVREGSSDRATAMKYVAKEATTGALATGAGVLLGAGLVALTGGIAAPVVFAVSAAGSIGAKRVLRRLVR